MAAQMRDRHKSAGSAATARLRHDIDSGRTGDKVDWPDPAAAPLGTDEEAAGTPVPPALVEHTRALENEGPSRRQPKRRIGAAWVMFAIIGASAASILAWALS
jgi:hypothetical protein